MKKLFILLVLLFTTIVLNGQTQPYCKNDTADLELTFCDFEKGANAMKLFDKAEVSFRYATVIMHRHKRIKIFNDKGKDEADDDFISVRYILNHKKIIFFRNDYQDLRGFYKQLYEMLNEQIILKKA